MYMFTLAIYSVSYLLIAGVQFGYRVKNTMSPTDERSTRAGFGYRFLYPDTEESGDTYDIDVLTEPITRTRWTEFKLPRLGFQ